MSFYNIPRLSDDPEAVLREQRISDTEPGPILHDVDVLLNVIDSHGGLRVSGKQNRIYMKRLPEINARLSHPTEADYERPGQKAYPYVHGLYLLVRAAGLAGIAEGGTHPQLVLRNEVVDSWQTLNATEKYMALLEAWIQRANEEIVGGGKQISGPLDGILSFASNLDGGTRTFTSKSDREHLDYYPGFGHLALLHLFGWIELDEDGTAAKEPWAVNRAALTPFGAAIMQCLLDVMEAGTDEDEDPILYLAGLVQRSIFSRADLHAALHPYFPEWERHLAAPSADFEPGMHTLCVRILEDVPWYSGSFTARIAAPGTADLHELAEAVIEAVGFDYDHLYQFAYRDAYGRGQTVAISFEELEPPYADEVSLGSLPLEEGSRFLFVYDFGDWWEFGIEVESIDPASDEEEDVEILETEGERPEQYPSVR
jgi:hypothetical protein